METRKCEPQLDSIVNFMVFILRKGFGKFLFMIHAFIPRSSNETHYFSLIYKFSRREILDQKYRFPFSFEINCVSKKIALILMHLNKPNFFSDPEKIPQRKNRNFHDKFAISNVKLFHPSKINYRMVKIQYYASRIKIANSILCCKFMSRFSLQKIVCLT